MRKFLLFLILPLALSLVSCSREVRAEHCELGIILSSDFEPCDTGGAFDLAYSDGELTVGMVRVSYAALVDSGIPATLSVRELAELYRASSGHSKTVFDYGDTVYYTYTAGGRLGLP